MRHLASHYDIVFHNQMEPSLLQSCILDAQLKDIVITIFMTYLLTS